ncbi:hypothetical protein ABVT39_012518 [Epinephelus coioides]
MVEGKLLVCVCISRGNPLAPITWPSLTDFSVTSSSSIQTVNSIITMSAADYHDTSVKCISSNELGRAEVEIPLQNYTENRPNYELDSNHSSNAVLPWIITGVSLSLNLILLTSLIICMKRCWGKSQQRELGEDMNTYASLNQPDVGQEYSVISPRTRGFLQNTRMTLIYSVILCLFFKARICQLQCVKETLDDTEFSINVTTHIEVEATDCDWISYEFTFPTNKVTAPYRKIWFKGDPQNTIRAEVVDTVESRTKGTLTIRGLPQGEYEYGFKLEWGCNQTYIFPKRVRISVSASTETPGVMVPPMTEGQRATLQCTARRLCSDGEHISWLWTNAGGRSLLDGNDGLGDAFISSRLTLTPTADHHNTNITCAVDYGLSVVETTVTLDVKFSPKILNSSQCMVEGKLLVCVCISRGNPLAPITWPSLTDFSVTSSSSIQTVNSIITTSAADYHDTSVKCISSNELGRAEVEIPLQNYTDNRPNYELDSNHSSNAVLPWIITGVSLSLNLILLTSLIICIKRCRGKSQQRELGDEMNTYASLNQPDVGQVYSVISPRTRGVSRKGPGVARDTP